MKAIKLLIVGIFVVSMISCDDIMDDMQLKIDAGSYQTELDVKPLNVPENVLTRSTMRTDLDAVLAENGETGSEIKAVRISDAILEISDKSKVKNFNAFESLEVIISSDIMDVETIATYVNSSSNANKIKLDPNLINVKEFVDSDEYEIFVTGRLKDNIVDTLKVKCNIRYQLELGS